MMRLLLYMVYHCLRRTYKDMYFKRDVIVLGWGNQSGNICTNEAIKGWEIHRGEYLTSRSYNLSGVQYYDFYNGIIK